MAINEFEAVLDGGQRANRFRFNFTLPAGVTGDIRELSLLGKSTTLPGKDTGQIELKRAGKTIRLKGDTVTTPTFTVLFQVPKKSKDLLDVFEQWENLEEDYKTKCTADLLNLANEVELTKEITGVWVVSTPGLVMDEDSADTILEFEVSFSADDIINL